MKEVRKVVRLVFHMMIVFKNRFDCLCIVIFILLSTIFFIEAFFCSCISRLCEKEKKIAVAKLVHTLKYLLINFDVKIKSGKFMNSCILLKKK